MALKTREGTNTLYQWSRGVRLYDNSLLGKENVYAVFIDSAVNKTHTVGFEIVEGTMSVEVPYVFLERTAPFSVYTYFTDEWGKRKQDTQTFEVLAAPESDEPWYNDVEEAIKAHNAEVLALTGTEQSTAEEAVAEINATLAETLTNSGVEASATEQTDDLITKIPDIPNYAAAWNARTRNGTYFANLFAGATWLEHVPYIDFSKCTNAAGMFKNCTNVKSIEAINVDHPICLSGLFQACESLPSIPDINWQMAVGSFQYVFYDCKSLKSLKPIISPSDSGSYNGAAMFRNCAKLKEIELTCCMGSISEIVYGCTSLRSLKLTQNNEGNGIFGCFGTTNPFYNCTSLTDLELNLNPSGGGLIVANWSFQHSPLNLKSATRFITQLTDVSATTNAYKYSISFSEHTWALLDADGNASPNGNTWREYLMDKGWNNA